MSRRRKILLSILAVVLLVPTAAMYVVATTERGLQFVARRLGKVGSVTIDVGTVTGTLVDGFTVDKLRVQHRLSDITIENASGRIELLPLMLLQRVTLPEVKVAHVGVIMLRSPDDPKREPRFLPPMLRVDADSVHADVTDITLQSGRVVQLRNIDGVATVYPRQIRVRSGRAQYDIVNIVASGHLEAARPLGLDGDAELTWSIEGQPDWLVAAEFDGDLTKLPITGRVHKPFHASFEGAATTLNKGWNFAGHARVLDFNLQPFGGGTALGIISGELDVTSVGSAFTAKGRLTPPGLEAGAFGVDFRGSYSQKVVTIPSTVITHAASGARATTHGTVTIVKGGPQLNLSGDWTRFRWPLASATPSFSSPRGTYALAGVKPWNVQVDGDVIAVEQPPMPARMRGLLSGESLRIDEASVQALGGTARFTGEARWRPGESWNVAGRMTEMDTARLRADLPGQASFDFKASGAPFGAEGSLDLDMQRITGKLRGHNLSGKGAIAQAANSEDWQFRGVDVSLGRTRLQLDGAIGKQNDIRFAINADDLSLFDPEARGRIAASGRYAGTSEVPQLQFKGRGTDFEWKEYKLAALDADFDLDMRPEGHAQGHVDATKLTVGSRTMQKASLALTGSGSAQRLTLAIDAEPLTSTLVAQGNMKDGLWQGTLQNFTLQDTGKLKLALEAPATLAVNLTQQHLGQTCLKGATERLCLSGEHQPDRTWRANLTGDSIPLSAFTAGLTQDVDYDGTIGFQAEFSGVGADLPVGTFRGQLQQAQLRHTLSNGNVEKMSLGSGTVTANATASGFTMQVGLDAGTAGNIKGELNGERNTGEWRGYPIKGNVEAKTDGLALLDVYVGGIDKATGTLITKVDIGGTLGAPTIQGLLQLRNATIDIYQVNLAMRELSLDANFNTESLDISGSSRLGTGKTEFNGKLTWKDGEPYGNLHVAGEKLRVVDVPEARVDASPSLDFKIAGHTIDARGKVVVPYARLEPADLTSVVLASSDERIVGAPVVEQRWQVTHDITVELGPDVRLDTRTLKARLGGAITVRGDESKVVRGDGELNIAEGDFRYAGRLLDIERGRLIFDNVPLSDPAVDLRAQKEVSEVIAGVHVRGLLRSPMVTFYSEPATLATAQIQALLLGGSLESVQSSNRSGAARNAILTQGLSMAAQPLSSRIGVDDIGVETDLSNETSLVLGRYLFSSKLYVSYGISLAEAINTLKLRYFLSDRWTAKAEAGKARSADIIFTIKK